MQNRPFPSSLVPLFQSESKCETILMKMTDLHENETACRNHFHMKGFALRLVLKQRHKRTRKWPIQFFASVLPESQVVYQPIQTIETYGLLLLYNNSEDARFFRGFTVTINNR